MASMTLAALRAEVIREGRIGSNVAETVLNAWIYEAVKKLQEDVKWLEKTRHFYVREYFTIGTDEGFGVRLTTATGTLNIVGPDTGYSNISGTSMAQLISTMWEADIGDTGVYTSFATGTFKFSVKISTLTNASTGMYVGPPSYSTAFTYDASYKLFGLTAETSVDAVTYTGSISPFCTSEYPLPSDFLYVKEVRYDDKSYPLKPTIYKSRDDATGTPSHFYIRGNWLGLTPQPLTGGKIIRLDYYYLPIDFAADTTVHPFPETFNYALIWYAIYLYKTNQDDTQGELKALAKYEQEKMKASQRKNARVGGAIDLQPSRTYDSRRYNI
jgi:hypothetical protein